MTFDPDEISYEELLERFWATHDPTTKNRQGPDLGSQYRSAIFFTSPEQLTGHAVDGTQEQPKLRRTTAARGSSTTAAHRHRDHPRRHLLARRGLPPALPREAGPRHVATSRCAQWGR